MTRGAAVLVQPGTPGADAAYPPAPSVWVPRFKWMGRYVSIPDNNPKNLTVGEIDAIAAVDGGIAYFVEQSESTVLGGDAGNRALARQAVKLANRFGLPAGCPFWYAVDVNPVGRFDVIARSFEVYNEETPDQWPVAGYVGSACGDFLLDRGLISYMHLPGATSWWGGYRSSNAHLRQYPSEPFGGTRIDRNDTLRPTPMWYPGRDHLDPEEEVDMLPDERQWLNDLYTAMFKHGRPDTPNGSSVEESVYASHRALINLTPDAIAAAVVRALPPAQTGGLTSQQVTDACLVALSQTSWQALMTPEIP